jgi:hypothetical protein
MEIAVDSYELDEEDYCVIKGGHFSALAMLGVEPCFESAKVTSKFSQEDIELAYAEMIESFKKYTLETLSEDFEENTETNETEDFIENEITVTEVEEDFVEDKEDEEDKDDIKEDEVEKEDDVDEDDEEEMAKKDDEEEKKCELEEEVECAKEEDDEDKKKCELIEAELIELKAQLIDLQSEYEALKSEYSALESEVIELRAFKQAEDLKAKEIALEENVFAKFEELKNLEGYAEIHALRFELDDKDLILRLKALAFDNGIIIGKKTKKEKQKVTKFSLDIKDTKKSSEWDILNLNKK